MKDNKLHKRIQSRWSCSKNIGKLLNIQKQQKNTPPPINLKIFLYQLSCNFAKK